MPEHIPDDDAWDVKVRWRGGDRWAVCRGRTCLDSDGEWDWETRPSERTDEWIATHRFDLDTALKLAIELAPGLRVNGWSVPEAIAAYDAQQRASEEAQ